MPVHLRAFPGVILALGLAACASSAGPPGPGSTRGAVPDLRGRRVLVLPVQLREGVPEEVTVDEEVAYALGARTDRVAWIFAPEVEEILRGSPSVQARPRQLPVGVFLQAEVRRVGDPLYGEIRRVTALVGADVAVLPVRLSLGDEGAYQLLVTLVSPVSGRVLWITTISGDPDASAGPAALASLADALARAVAPLR